MNMLLKVIKRNDVEQPFSLEKIENAIQKANMSVDEADRIDENGMKKILGTIKKNLKGFQTINVSDIHDIVEKSLIKHNKYAVSKSYILYRNKKEEENDYTDNEKKCLALVEGVSNLRGDNANKNIDDNGAIRDYFAGILSKSLTNKMLPKDIVNYHKKKIIHYHDADYHINPEHNCDLLNIEDMLTNTFQMQGTKIEPNKDTPFRTICNLLAQINLIVSGRQYGGQTISWSHTLPFINQTRQIIKKNIIEEYNNEEKIIKHVRLFLSKIGIKTGKYNIKQLNANVEKKLREEIYEGVKTYQYQILCHSSSNGQTPFVSNNLCLREAETEQELKDFAILIEEILKRRLKGVKDAYGHYDSPIFPKLLYWTSDGLNINEGDEYYYLTKLAAKCEAKRNQPDICSERQTRKVKKGQIIPCMGCRSLLAPIWEKTTYSINEKFYYVRGSNLGKDIDEKEIQNLTEKEYQDIAYPYGMFTKKLDFSSFKNGKYKVGDVRINFRGNTGWLLEKDDEHVVILQPKVYGRWNNGVVTINLPHVALTAREEFPNDIDKRKERFYEILDERLSVCRKALTIRYERCSKIKAKNSAILWEHGGLARMSPDETVGELMDKYPQRASISLGYVGLYETCEALINESNTTKKGQKLSVDILTYMNNKCDNWKKEGDLIFNGTKKVHINYSIYGTPEENLTGLMAAANRRDFGYIEKITDKDYVVNSYHVDPREKIDAFKKLEIEGKYLELSSGGAVSYVEVPDLTNNIEAILSIFKWMNHHIVYAEINRILGNCYKCGYEGVIPLIKSEDGTFTFKCPHCGNTDDNLMKIIGRICGYLGRINSGNTNKGRLDDVYNRTLNTDNFDEEQQWNEVQ